MPKLRNGTTENFTFVHLIPQLIYPQVTAILRAGNFSCHFFTDLSSIIAYTLIIKIQLESAIIEIWHRKYNPLYLFVMKVAHNNTILTSITSVHCDHDCRYGTDEVPFYSENALVSLLMTLHHTKE